ncbi:replicative DNA helicase [Kitasatospora sp. NPDC057223]|uniref:replicative DNA helicase n=1 Tax=Kitasatospora sp. NPDC057223 TaxID=3346055 RepID=UPI00362CC854
MSPDYDEPADDAWELNGIWDELAEQAVIGAMIISRRAIGEIELVLGNGDAFFREAHRILYKTILAIHDTPGQNGAPDPIKIVAALRSTGELQLAGGPSYPHRCVDAVPTGGVGVDYADIVLDLYGLRQIEQMGIRLVQRARLRDTSSDEIAGMALTELQQLFGETASSTEAKLSVADRWPDFLDELDAGADPRAVDTPWPDMNEVIQFKPKEVTIVGAATSGGKSLFALNQAAHVAFRRNLPVLVASMEMGGSELLSRLTSAEANIEMDAMMRRRFGDQEWLKIARVTERMTSTAASNFILDDSPVLTISKIRSRVRWMESQGRKPGLVVIDYAQLITPEGPNAGKNRTQDVANISLGMKRIADEFDVPVLALAQFNRGQAGRRPAATDFKDSSQIEQDASTVVLLHRELDEEGMDTGPNAGKVMAIIAKNRNGKRGVEVWLQFEGRYASLRNLTSQTPPL